MKKTVSNFIKTIAGVLTFLAFATSVFAQISLTTTYTGGNGQSGNMFDVTALNTVIINSFSGNFDVGGPYTVEIYYKTGSYVGSETNSAAWTLIGSTTLSATVTNAATAIPLNVNLTITSGSTYAFYITATTTVINYTNGTALGTAYAQDLNLQIFEGIGKAYPFGATYGGTGGASRIWNGTIHYSLQSVNYDFYLDPVTFVGSGGSGGTATYNLALNNFGLMNDSYNVTVSGNSFPTQVLLSGTPVTNTGNVNANSNLSLQIQVNIPASATQGQVDNTTVTFTSVGDPTVSHSASVTTTVINYDFNVSQTTYYGSGGSGTNIFYDVTVNNTGNFPDSYNLSFTGNNWQVQTLVAGTPVSNTGNVNANSNLSLQIQVNIPANLTPNQLDDFTLTLTSAAATSLTNQINFNSYAISQLPGGTLPDILYYKFDGTNTTNASQNYAVPGSGFPNAAINGLSLKNGVIGTGLASVSGSATTDFLNTGWNTSLFGDWTISFWVDLTALQGNTSADYIFGDPTASSFRCFTNGLAGLGNIMLRTTGLTGWNDLTITGITSGFVTIVHNAATAELKGYFNDTLVSTVATASPLVLNGTAPLTITSYGTTGTLLAGALIDEFKIYSSALVPGTILTQFPNTDVHDQSYEIGTKISSFAASADPNNVNLNWKLSTATTYNTIPMTSVSTDSFHAQIPATNSFGTTVQYYVSAGLNNGSTFYFPYNPVTQVGTPYSFKIELLKGGTLSTDPNQISIPLSWKTPGDFEFKTRNDDGTSEFVSILPNTLPGLNSPGAITFASKFNVQTGSSSEAQLKAVEFFVVTGGNPASPFKVKIFQATPSGPGNLISESATLTQGTSGGTFITVPFDPPVPVGNGSFFVGIQQTTTNQISLGGDESSSNLYSFAPNTHFIQGATASWSAIETIPIYGQVIPMIRAVAEPIPTIPPTLPNSWNIVSYKLYKMNGTATSSNQVVTNGTVIYNGTDLNYEDTNVLQQPYSYALTVIYDVNGTNTESAPGNLVVTNLLTVGIENENNVPKEYSLSQNYPNPFNPSTKINFTLKENGFTRLTIFNTLGQLVKTLVSEKLEAGTLQNVVWNGTDNNGNQVSSGIYFYKLESGNFSETKKMVLLK
ncbi:T9SS type A sorting domain-containing protein [bacterium]|nr:T9SS type A sorting domain-containing protein [bacterium]